MAGNLESLLLDESDDSSDGEDDNKRSAPAAAAAAPVAPAAPPPVPTPAAPAPPRAAPTTGPPVAAPGPGTAPSAPAPGGSGPVDPPTSSMDPSEISRRLKSLYSPASRNRPTTASSPSAPALNPPAPPIAAASAPVAAVPQRVSSSFQQQSQQQPQTLRRSSSGGVATGSAFASPNSASVTRSPGTPQHGAARVPSASGGASSAPAGTAHDPFEPTPLHDIIEKVHHRNPPRPSGAGTTTPQPSASSSVGGRLNPTPVSSMPRGGSTSTAAPNAVPSSSSGQPTPVGSSSSYPPGMNRSSSTGSASAAGLPRRVPSARSSSASGSANPHAVAGSSGRMPGGAQPSSSAEAAAAAAAENKRRKEQFLTFTRVLMKYIEQKDGAVHRRATEVIKECAEKHRSGDPNYASLTTSMQLHLRRVVGDVYWRKAEEYLRHILKRQRSSQSGPTTPGVPGAGSAPPASSVSVAPGGPRSISGSSSAPAAASVAGADQDPMAKIKNDARIAAGLPPIPPSQQLQHAPTAPPIKTAAVASAVPPRVPSSSVAPPKQPQVSNPPVAPPAATPPQTLSAPAPGASAMTEQLERAKRDREMEDMRRAAAEQHNRQQQEKAKQQAAKKAPRVLQDKKKVPQVAAKALPKPEAVPSSLPAVATAPASTPLTPSTTQTKTVPPTAQGGKKGKTARRSSSTGTLKTTGGAVAGKNLGAPGTPTPTSVVAGVVDPTAAIPTIGAAAAQVSSVLQAPAMIIAPPKPEPPPKEYAVLMEEVDHALRYDWTNSNMLLSPEFKMDVNLDQEQRMLLYGSSTMGGASGRRSSSGAVSHLLGGGKSPPSPRYSVTGVASPRGSARRRRSSVVGDDAAAQARLSGWGKRNVVSVRAAWSLLRLPEVEALKDKGNNTIEAAGESLPKIPGVSVTIKGSSSTPDSAASDASKIAWTNEETAEEDDTLALLSEAAEVYLKSILEGAVAAARQRQNLDGIRLWHQQHLPKAPPLSLRLGCDVRRQVALGAGNAAKTVQRMEEALDRDREGAAEVCTGVVDDETLRSVQSMAELSLRPKLAAGVSRSEHDAKRSFEVYGGKDSGGPPLGRVPKKAKIIVGDFDASMNLPSFPFARKGATML